MKKYLLIAVLLVTHTAMYSQTTDLVVDNQTPGWLSSKINYSDQQTIRTLKVTGYVNASDLKFIGTLIQSRALKDLLDLSEVSVVAMSSSEEDNEMGENIFGLERESSAIKKVILPKTLVKLNNIFLYKPNNTTSYYVDVDTLLFDCNTKYLCSDFFGCTPKHIVVGENVDSIPGDNGGLMYGLNPAFKDKRLQSIILPSSMRIINEYAFDGCSSLQYVNLIELKDLEYLGVAAFRKTEYKPDTLYIPNTLTNNTYFLRSFSFENIYCETLISGYLKLIILF